MAAARYHIERCLGRGGFGEVYLATRHSSDGLERRVAVKVLRDDVHNPTGAVARLQDEGRMLAMLDHPAIVRVVELTQIGGRIALVTEYVDGVDLARYSVRGSLLPPRVVADALSEVAQALHTASYTISPETGKPLLLIHRDVKPENIRVSRHGEAKLLDFGIARTEEVGRQARTTTGNVPFTAGYTAPETFVELKQHPPSDVFAWGATLFRLLTGDRFYSDLKLTEQASLSGSPGRWSRWLEKRVRSLPEEADPLRELLSASLAWDPAARPAIGTCGEELESLAANLRGPPLKRWIRDNPTADEPSLPGALVGQVVSADAPDASFAFARPARKAPPPPPAPRGLHLQPPLRESTTDRPPFGPMTYTNEPPPTSWMVRLGAGMVVAMFGLAIVLFLLAMFFSAMWLAR